MTPAAHDSALDKPTDHRRLTEDRVLALELAERRLARGSLEAWLYRYLPAQFDRAPGDFHRSVYRDLESLVSCEEIDGEVRDAAAYAYPRGHGKTTTITLGFVAWIVHEWRSMPFFQDKPPFILIVSDSGDNARDRLLDLRNELEENEELRTDYGDLTPSADRAGRRAKWTEKDFTTRDGVRVKAVGANGKVRGLLRKGQRPTLIVFDDLENDEHVETAGQRNKLHKWLVRALIPTGIEGDVLTLGVGTVLHADSVLSRLLDPHREDTKGWLKRKYAAAYDDAGLPNAEGPHVLWPARWPLRLLQRRRAKIGSVAFAQEYLNLPIDDEAALFRMEWLLAAKNRGQGRGFLYDAPNRIPWDVVISTWDPVELAERSPDVDAYQIVVTAWDLAILEDVQKARERNTDFTVGITIGLTVDDKLEVRRVFRKRGMPPGEVRARVIGEQEIVGADAVAVENNAAQKLHEIELRGKVPVVGHTTDKRKHSVYEGVPGLAYLLELGRLTFCWSLPAERERIEIMIGELHGLGVEAHDDTVMALWIAVTVIRRWIRKRDQRRRRLIGPPPVSYQGVFPARREDDAEQEAA